MNNTSLDIKAWKAIIDTVNQIIRGKHIQAERDSAVRTWS